MVSLWVPYGFLVVFLMVPVWFPCGFLKVSLRFLQGVFMVPLWFAGRGADSCGVRRARARARVRAPAFVRRAFGGVGSVRMGTPDGGTGCKRSLHPRSENVNKFVHKHSFGPFWTVKDRCWTVKDR